ncbi:MAG: GGDEF domain-containing protein [Candidatus Coproplasma sp.]
MFNLYDATTVITIITLIITFADVVGNKIVAKGKKITVITISLLIALVALCEWAGVRCDGSALNIIWLHYAVKYVEFCVTPFIGLVATIAYGYPKNPKSMAAFLVINVIVQTVSLWTGWVFYIDAGNVYHRAGLYFVYALSFAASTLYCIIITLIGNKNYRFRIDLTQVLTFTLVTAGFVIQFATSTIRVIFLCLAVGNYVLYNCYVNAIMKLDALTKLFTRRCYEINLHTAHKKATVVFFDVNDFKHVNDCYGHAQGDECLKKIGAAIHSVYSRSGNCYRIGGDEFCVILKKRVQTVRFLNLKFYEEIKQLRKEDPRMPTVAVGFAKRNSGDSCIEDTLKRADEMMYANKKLAKKRAAGQNDRDEQ